MWQNNVVIKFLEFEFTKLTKYFSSNFSVFSGYFSLIEPYLIVFLVVSIILFAGYWIIRLYLIFKESKKPCTFLEVSPPKTTEQSSYTTTQLFTGVHGLLRQRSWIYRFFDIYKSYSFELASSKEHGIRYIMRIPVDDAHIIKKNLIAYLPGIQVKEIGNYLMPSESIEAHVTEFALSKAFPYPLKKQDSLQEYDPIAYITATMTKLLEDEQVSFQVITSPIGRDANKKVTKLRQAFLTNQNAFIDIQNLNDSYGLVWLLVNIVMRILVLPAGLIVWIFTGGREGPLLPVSFYSKKPVGNTYKDIVETQVKQKIDQQLFSVSIRLFIQTKSLVNRLRIEKGFVAALSPFTNGGFQSLKVRRYLKLNIINRILLFLFEHRLLMGSNLILSSSELSDIYHFPYTSTTKTENLSKIHSKELPAPLSLKQKKSCDLYFAKNTYGGTDTLIGLTEDERRRHVYVLGATGTGKSTMLLSMIKQDIDHNKGLCVIDPHGDLTDQIISIIPENRIPEVIYFNPDDISYPMGINLLELTLGLDSEDTIREKEFIAESIISVFQKIYTDKYSGPRMEYILRNTIHTAFTVPDATLFTIYKLLINTPFRKSVVKNLTDENLKDFWKYEFAKAGDYQKVKMISPITNKIGRFLFSPTAKRILEQPKSTINFDSIMNESKILLCNLSKGKIGEDNSSVFGVLIMAKIQLAALKRARMKQEERKDFYLYVDEFQNFATPAFAQILSEARKYRLNAILAHQTTSQLEETSLVNVTLANTGTVICFRTANPEDERVILPQFQPYIDKGEIASLPSYRFYMRLGAMNPEEPFSGITMPVKIDQNQKNANEVIESSRNLFAKKYTGASETHINTTPKQQPKKSFSVLP